MKRRNFIKHSALSASAMLSMPYVGIGRVRAEKMDRIALTTVVFRNRFQLTKPKNQVLKNELSLLEIPEYFDDRFNIQNVEIWTKHFESTSKHYLGDLKKKLKKHNCKLIDLQAEGKFDPSDPLEKQGKTDVRDWF